MNCINPVFNPDTALSTQFVGGTGVEGEARRAKFLSSSPFRQKDYKMKLMDFCARLGARAQPDRESGKTGQRRMAQKDAISCKHFGETDY